MNNHVYITNCVGADGDSISSMISLAGKGADAAYVLSYPDLKKRLEVGFWQQFAEKESEFKNDWHINYEQSTYQGFPCIYIRHSAIEHVYVDQNAEIMLPNGYYSTFSEFDADEIAQRLDSLTELSEHPESERFIELLSQFVEKISAVDHKKLKGSSADSALRKLCDKHFDEIQTIASLYSKITASVGDDIKRLRIVPADVIEKLVSVINPQFDPMIVLCDRINTKGPEFGINLDPNYELGAGLSAGVRQSNEGIPTMNYHQSQLSRLFYPEVDSMVSVQVKGDTTSHNVNIHPGAVAALIDAFDDANPQPIRMNAAEMNSYAQKNILQAIGDSNSSDFYSVKFTGHVSTKWMNFSQSQVDSLLAVLSEKEKIADTHYPQNALLADYVAVRRYEKDQPPVFLSADKTPLRFGDKLVLKSEIKANLAEPEIVYFLRSLSDPTPTADGQSFENDIAKGFPTQVFIDHHTDTTRSAYATRMVIAPQHPHGSEQLFISKQVLMNAVGDGLSWINVDSHQDVYQIPNDIQERHDDLLNVFKAYRDVTDPSYGDDALDPDYARKSLVHHLPDLHLSSEQAIKLLDMALPDAMATHNRGGDKSDHAEQDMRDSFLRKVVAYCVSNRLVELSSLQLLKQNVVEQTPALVERLRR